MTTDPAFIENIEAGLDYWYEETSVMSAKHIESLQGNRQNLYQLVQFGIAWSTTKEKATVVALQAFDLVEQKGYWPEWLSILEKAERSFNSQNEALKFKLLNRLGQLYRLNGQLSEAIEAHQKAVEIAINLSDQVMLAKVYTNLGEIFLLQRNYQQAERFGKQALSIFQGRLIEDRSLAAVLNTLGEIARQQGDYVSAERLLSEAIQIATKLKLTLYQVRFLNNLAVVFQAKDDYEEARNCLQKAAEILDKTPNELDKSMIQINLGLLYFRQNKWADAETAFQEANSPYLQRSSHIRYQALVANNLGNALLKQGKFEKSKLYLTKAVSLWTQLQDNLELANTLGSLAEVHVGLETTDTALQLYTKAIDLLTLFPDNAWGQKLLNSFRQQKDALKV